MAREGNKLEQTKFGKITFSLQYINFSNIWSRFGAENIRSFLATVCGKVCSSNCLNLIFALRIQWELMKKTSAWFAMNQMPLVLWAQFHQHFTYEFFVRTLFWQLFSSYMSIEKAAKTMCVQKSLEKNVDEIDNWG